MLAGADKFKTEVCDPLAAKGAARRRPLRLVIAEVEGSGEGLTANKIYERL